MLSRNSKARLNSVVTLAYQLVLLACGFVVPYFLIEAFGSEAYGATVSIAQFLGFITLFEGGISGVARSALYRLIAKNDIDGISAVMLEIRKFFRIIGCIFFVYVIVLAVSYKSISHVECLDWISSAVLVLVISLSTFGQYFIGLSDTVLLRASQKLYICNAVMIVTTIVNALTVVLLVYFGFSLIIVKLASSFIFFLRPVVLHLYVKRKYELVKKPSQAKLLEQKWNGLSQQIAHFIHFNTDVVVLTCFMGLSSVAVYAVHNMVVSNMQNLVCSCLAGAESLFGDMISKKEEAELNRSFEHHEILISVVAVVFFSTTAVLIVPFVELYTAGIVDTNYTVPAFAFLLVFSGMLYCLRMPYHSIVVAAGHFKQTQMSAYGEAAINVGLSVLLVNQFGLPGVAVATVAGTAFRFGYYVIYLSKHILKRNIRLFVKRAAVNAVAFAAAFVVGSALVSSVHVTDFFIWVICSAEVLILVVAVVLGINALVYRKEVAATVHKITSGRNARK